MARFVLCFAFLALVSCAGDSGPRWQKPGATAEMEQRDREDCGARAVTRADVGPRGPSNRSRLEAEFERCMESRGWTRRPVGGGSE